MPYSPDVALKPEQPPPLRLFRSGAAAAGQFLVVLLPIILLAVAGGFVVTEVSSVLVATSETQVCTCGAI